MRLSVSTAWAVIIMLGAGLSAHGPAAHAQACGCGVTYVVVGDEEGNAIEGVTVEFLLEGRTLPHCGDRSPAKQGGAGRKLKFRFRSYENGPPEALLRVAAPGRATFEEKGKFMSGCYERFEVILSKKGQSYRT